MTIPAGVDEYYASLGATSLTLESQSTTENGLASADGPASGAVNPTSEMATATNIPQTLSPLGNAPISYSVANNPVTWQTGPGTGTVYLTPGDVSVVVTYVVGGTPTTSTINCTPPSNEDTLDTTVVNPAPTGATYQVATSSPPTQASVTSGSDDGWTFTVTNTSQASVTGLQTQVTISDGGTPPSFDTAAITASGTKGCTVTSPGVLTCTENRLAAGESDSINVLVDTSSLSAGAAVTGSAAVSSTNAGSATDNLGQFSVVVVNNGVEAVATPGIAVTSSTAPLSETGGDVKLTLPKTKVQEMGPMASGVHPNGGGGTVKPPVVGLTLESLAGVGRAGPLSAGRRGLSRRRHRGGGQLLGLCEPGPSGDRPHPDLLRQCRARQPLHVHARVQRHVAKLPACKKTAGDYNTPCVKGKQKTIGSSGALSLQATVLFTANDPGFTFR